MTQLTFTVPTVGQNNTTEDPLIATALSAIKSAVNGNLDKDNFTASAGVLLSQLEALSSGRIVVGNGSNVATPVAMSGDVTISNAGVTTIGNDKITQAKMADNAIGNAEMADNAVGAAEVIDGSLTSAKINSAGILTSKVTRPTLFNDGSTGGATAIGTTYVSSGATFTADQTGMHLMVTNGPVNWTSNTGSTRIVYWRLFVDGVAFGTENRQTINPAGSGFDAQYCNLNTIELASLTAGNVIDLRVKCSNAGVLNYETAADIVIKAVCLTK